MSKHRDAMIAHLNRLRSWYGRIYDAVEPEERRDFDWIMDDMRETIHKAWPVANPAAHYNGVPIYVDKHAPPGPMPGYGVQELTRDGETIGRFPTPTEMAREQQREWAAADMTCRVHNGARVLDEAGGMVCEHGCAGNNVVGR